MVTGYFGIWKMIIAVASSVFILVEIEKFFIRLFLPKTAVKGTANNSPKIKK
jgi:hypothetical protein